LPRLYGSYQAAFAFIPWMSASKHFFVAFGIHLFVHLSDDALGIDHESGALPELHPFPFRLAEAERLHQAGFGVGKQDRW
jgi:hypothetical protein